jgi:hypothetical protein
MMMMMVLVMVTLLKMIIKIWLSVSERTITSIRYNFLPYLVINHLKWTNGCFSTQIFHAVLLYNFF